MAERVLVLGGTRSGKSAAAETLVADADAVTYIATGSAGDAEMAARISDHRRRRPATWTTVESTDLRAAIAAAGGAVLVDDLGGWLAARMTAHGLWPDETDGEVAPPSAATRAAARRLRDEASAWWQAAAEHDGGLVVVVGDESGLGVVPADPTSRRWLDLAGDVVQDLAGQADRVLLVVAGRALDLPAGGLTAAAPTGTSRWASGAASSGPSTPSLRAHGDTMVPADALDFAVNVHGSGPPEHLRAALRRADERLGAYPDIGPVRAVVAARHGRSPREVLLTAGAAEALWLSAGLASGRRAVVVHPQFTEAEAALRAADADVEQVLRRPDDGWRLDPDGVPADAEVVVVGNPNNPTGSLDDPEAVARLCRPGRLVVVDEAFADFVADPQFSLAGRRDLPGLVVVRSVTKLWGLPGVRAGYLIAAAELVADLEQRRQPWPLGAHALAALEACAGDDAYRARVAAEVQIARDRLVAALRGIDGVTVWPGAANFLLLRVPDGPAVHRGLLERGIAVRPSTFPGLDPDHLRVAVRNPADNDALVAALRSVLAGR